MNLMLAFMILLIYISVTTVTQVTLAKLLNTKKIPSLLKFQSQYTIWIKLLQSFASAYWINLAY